MAIKRKLIKTLTAVLSIGLLLSGCGKKNSNDFQTIAMSKGFEVTQVDDMAPKFLQNMGYADKENQEQYENLILKPIEHVEKGYYIKKFCDEGQITGMYITFDSVKHAANSFLAQISQEIILAVTYNLPTNFKGFTKEDIEKFTIAVFADKEQQVQKEKEAYSYAVGFKPEENAIIGVSLTPNEGELMKLTPEEQIRFLISEVETLGFEEHCEESWAPLTYGE